MFNLQKLMIMLKYEIDWNRKDDIGVIAVLPQIQKKINPYAIHFFCMYHSLYCLYLHDHI